MTDIIDAANDITALQASLREADIRASAAAIPLGEAGECDLCGEHSARLVDGACAPCRDKYHLP